jgi:hypothetical protein
VVPLDLWVEGYACKLKHLGLAVRDALNLDELKILTPEVHSHREIPSR